MLSTLNIPKKIKIGFQERRDTYTGKLGYVIYYDNKGVLRKEKSWEGWRSKDIEPVEYDNVPTDGFVLNRHGGGGRRSYSWDARNEFVRVWDPRGFEFEISIENVLFLLQECSSIKGKGLEGEMVYSWNGATLVLLPVNSQEFKESTNFNILGTKKVGAKDVVVGCSYLTKNREELMYMGRLDWHTKESIKSKDSKGYNHWNYKMVSKKKHVFLKLADVYCMETNNNKNSLEVDINNERKYLILDGFTKLGERTSINTLPIFAEEFMKIEKSIYRNTPVKLLDVEDNSPIDITGENYWKRFRPDSRMSIKYNDKLYMVNLEVIQPHDNKYISWYNNEDIKHIYDYYFNVNVSSEVIFKDNMVYYVEFRYNYNCPKQYLLKNIKLEDILPLRRTLQVEYSNGEVYDLNSVNCSTSCYIN